VKEQEAQSKGVAVRRGLKQPSARGPVRNASEHDSARQVGEPASQERNQVRNNRNGWHSQNTEKGGCSSLSGGWWRNGSRSDEQLTRENHVENGTGVHSARRANRADKEPGRVEVRASIVAVKRGNARGVKGRRKIDRIKPARRKLPPSVIRPLGDRSVQGGELCPAKGIQRNTFQLTLTRCWQAATKRSQTPLESSHRVAEPGTPLFESPGRFGMPVSRQTLSTGEPDARKPPVRFGGRGDRRRPYPYLSSSPSGTQRFHASLSQRL
jgi:hypothetical protein